MLSSSKVMFFVPSLTCRQTPKYPENFEMWSWRRMEKNQLDW